MEGYLIKQRYQQGDQADYDEGDHQNPPQLESPAGRGSPSPPGIPGPESPSYSSAFPFVAFLPPHSCTGQLGLRLEKLTATPSILLSPRLLLLLSPPLFPPSSLRWLLLRRLLLLRSLLPSPRCFPFLRLSVLW